MTVPRRGPDAVPVPMNSVRDLSPQNASLGTMLYNRTGSWRYLKPQYRNLTPPCQNACPAGNDVEGWIRLLAAGEPDQAYRHLTAEQPFPAILGRVCFRFCEGPCNRGLVDRHVGINRLEQYLGDLSPRPTDFPEPAPDNGKSLAVVGSGPAGMSAALFARRLGFRVTVFESRPDPGGLLRYGIPAYRLPREVVAAEFARLTAMGIRINTGAALGEGLKFADLTRDHDYVFIGVGAQSSRRLGLDQEAACSGVMSGISFLRQAAEGEKPQLGRRVLVIGGGNTAIDAARTAVRLGAEATVLYRRSEQEMPAHPEEVAEAREEGVVFRFMTAPEKLVLEKDGRLAECLCCAMEAGPPDADGRARPVKTDQPLFAVDADTIITAVGESADPDFLSGLAAATGDGLTVDAALAAVDAVSGGAMVFAGGDAIPGQRTVVHAVAAGKRAALAMDCHRRGVPAAEALAGIAVGKGKALSFARYLDLPPLTPVHWAPLEVAGPERMVFDYFAPSTPVAVRSTDAATRKTSFAPYKKEWTAQEAAHEAERCLHCGRCVECDNCLIFCPDSSVRVPEDGGFGYFIDYDYCKGCGLCAAECPRGAVSMTAEKGDAEEVRS